MEFWVIMEGMMSTGVLWIEREVEFMGCWDIWHSWFGVMVVVDWLFDGKLTLKNEKVTIL